MIRNREVASKHIIAGTERVVTKLMKQDKPGANPNGAQPLEVVPLPNTFAHQSEWKGSFLEPQRGQAAQAAFARRAEGFSPAAGLSLHHPA